MPSGGARARSGPPADPNALRRDRTDDAGWTILPADGFKGAIPDFPLAPAVGAEVDLWEKLWRKPQGEMWSRLGLEFEVAAYVRAFIESVEPEATAGLKTAVLRMAAEIGLSLPGMHGLRWKIADSVADTARPAPERKASSSRARLRAVPNVGSE
jgi:hypothetical protein